MESFFHGMELLTIDRGNMASWPESINLKASTYEQTIIREINAFSRLKGTAVFCRIAVPAFHVKINIPRKSSSDQVPIIAFAACITSGNNDILNYAEIFNVFYSGKFNGGPYNAEFDTTPKKYAFVAPTNNVITYRLYTEGNVETHTNYGTIQITEFNPAETWMYYKESPDAIDG